MTRVLMAALAALLALPAAAQWQVEFGAGQENVRAGADWRQLDLALRHTLAPRTTVELAARRTSRYGLTDREFGLAGSMALGSDWTANAALTTSPTHEVLPRWSLAAGAQRALGSGWVLGGEARSTRYSDDRADALRLNVERYFGGAEVGAWRAALALGATRLQGASTAGAGRIQLDRYFGDRGRLGLLLARGDEAERDELGQLAVNDVRSVVLLGRWPLGERFALTGEWGHHRVGAVHRRSGGRLGVQLDF
jgi:YaiO family outer membrane protein